MLFKLVEESKDDVIGLTDAVKKQEQEDMHKGSRLKSENPQASIIQGIQSTYPLAADFDFTKGKVNKQEIDEQVK